MEKKLPIKVFIRMEICRNCGNVDSWIHESIKARSLLKT